MSMCGGYSEFWVQIPKKVSIGDQKGIHTAPSKVILITGEQTPQPYCILHKLLK